MHDVDASPLTAATPDSMEVAPAAARRTLERKEVMAMHVLLLVTIGKESGATSEEIRDHVYDTLIGDPSFKAVPHGTAVAVPPPPMKMALWYSRERWPGCQRTGLLGATSP